MEHADIISQVEMQLLGKETAPFSFTSNDSLKATNIIAKALNQNAEKLNKQKDIIRIAPLFFQNKEPGGRLS